MRSYQFLFPFIYFYSSFTWILQLVRKAHWEEVLLLACLCFQVKGHILHCPLGVNQYALASNPLWLVQSSLFYWTQSSTRYTVLRSVHHLASSMWYALWRLSTGQLLW